MKKQMPFVVGVGGTNREGSSGELILRRTLSSCEALGARTQIISGSSLLMPMYTPGSSDRTPEARELVKALRAADGILICSPGYHGTISGLVKNALDYTEDMSGDERPYFDARAVGLIAVAAGWQACGTTMSTLRSMTHALRGWPTPLGVSINSAQPLFSEDGSREITSAPVLMQLETLAEQVYGFASLNMQEPG